MKHRLIYKHRFKNNLTTNKSYEVKKIDLLFNDDFKEIDIKKGVLYRGKLRIYFKYPKSKYNNHIIDDELIPISKFYIVDDFGNEIDIKGHNGWEVDTEYYKKQERQIKLKDLLDEGKYGT